MREAQPLERAVGVEWYASDADGVGGRLRNSPEDFRVREVERFEAEPLDADPGAYPYLVVRATLRGWDTNAFARSLSDRLQMSRGRVDWAGTKDADAVTTQLFTLRDVDPGDLSDLRDADLEPVGRAGRAIEFGDLAGNEFEVTVRDADRPENADAVTAALRAFAAGESADADVSTGADSNPDAPVAVPNFFGQQRFGSRRPVTHEVGLRIVRREWREAALAYVGNPSEAEPPETREARAAVDRAVAAGDPDWNALLEEFPRWLDHERAILGRLAESPGAFRDALEALPWNLRRLFVNAAQSYAFNRILSERLDRGLPFARAVEGDVVCFAEAVDGLVVPDADRTQRATERRVRTVNRHCERGRAFVTAPLVGTDTEFADGEPGEIERAVLDDAGLAPADFDLPGEFASAGTRRAVLVRTDLDVARDPLTFSFALPKGSYATVVLREYLKASPLDL